jgi:YVTN family beta-propeller protein
MKRVIPVAAELRYLIALLSLCFAARVAQAQVIYATVPDTNSVAVIDGSNNSLLTTIAIAASTATGSGTHPASIAITPDGKTAYVVNQACSPSSTVSVINTATNAVATTIPISGCPQEIALTPDGSHGYVTTRVPPGVLVIDLSTNAVVATISLGSGDRPSGVVVSPHGDYVWVGSNNTGNSLYAIATATNTVVSTTTIPDPQLPGTNATCGMGELVVSPDANFLLGTCSANEAVMVDAHTAGVAFNVLVSCSAGAPAITPDQTKAYVADVECGSLTERDLGLSGTTSTFQLCSTSCPSGDNPTELAFTADSSRGYVTAVHSSGGAVLLVFDTATKGVITYLPLNGKSAGGLAIARAATSTALSASVNPSTFGQQVSFSVTVTPAQASALTPTGTVTFSDGSTVLGTVALSSGTAIFNFSGLGIGSHNITASYGGDNLFGTSSSVAATQIVNQAATTTTLAASPSPATLGQSVILTASVSVVAPGSGSQTPPTGTVNFFDNGTSLTCIVGAQTNQTVAAGQATCQYTDRTSEGET